jgi:hypothetical protein
MPLELADIDAWFRYGTTRDQQRVLTSILGHRENPFPKRRLQQRLRRMHAVPFNQALNDLKELGIVASQGAWLMMPPEVRDALIHASASVRQKAHRERALATGTRSRRARVKLIWYEDRRGRLRRRRAFVKGRRTLPPEGTSDWGRSMAAKKGGLARQRQCRELGINPTAAATAARRAQKGLHAAPALVVHAAVPEPQPLRRKYRRSSSNNSAPLPPIQQPSLRADAWGGRRRDGSGVAGNGLSQAYRQLRLHPVGREARLAAERNRPR